MDVDGYMDWVERNTDDPDTLVHIRATARDDDALSAEQREDVEQRVGTYLADHERETGETVEEDDASAE